MNKSTFFFISCTSTGLSRFGLMDAKQFVHAVLCKRLSCFSKPSSLWVKACPQARTAPPAPRPSHCCSWSSSSCPPLPAGPVSEASGPFHQPSSSPWQSIQTCSRLAFLMRPSLKLQPPASSSLDPSLFFLQGVYQCLSEYIFSLFCSRDYLF